ncbi:unnamed protein product [Protopolystoma xenopodis]|uniref:Uncharacterized protein n=1 Tax=Protopolystoma xenopodis TaxID=117903 RepID=A0A448XP32_9PLAT|nr:unnamed protein product [Protopolystoma xenopodis]
MHLIFPILPHPPLLLALLNCIRIRPKLELVPYTPDSLCQLMEPLSRPSPDLFRSASRSRIVDLASRSPTHKSAARLPTSQGHTVSPARETTLQTSSPSKTNHLATTGRLSPLDRLLCQRLLQLARLGLNLNLIAPHRIRQIRRMTEALRPAGEERQRKHRTQHQPAKRPEDMSAQEMVSLGPFGDNERAYGGLAMERNAGSADLQPSSGVVLETANQAAMSARDRRPEAGVPAEESTTTVAATTTATATATAETTEASKVMVDRAILASLPRGILIQPPVGAEDLRCLGRAETSRSQLIGFSSPGPLELAQLAARHRQQIEKAAVKRMLACQRLARRQADRVARFRKRQSLQNSSHCPATRSRSRRRRRGQDDKQPRPCSVPDSTFGRRVFSSFSSTSSSSFCSSAAGPPFCEPASLRRLKRRRRPPSTAQVSRYNSGITIIIIS